MMATHDPSPRTLRATAWAYMVPMLSLMLSLPTLLGLLGLCAIGGYYALTGQTTDLGGLDQVVQWPLASALILLYGVFGPMAGVVICLSQRVRMPSASGDVPALARPLARMNAVALRTAAVAVGLVIVLVGTGMLARGGT